MFIVSILMSLMVSFSQAESVNSPELYKEFLDELKSPAGVEVEVHGVDLQNGLYVVSYRPKNFFDYVIISLQADYLSKNFAAVDSQLKTLKRHDAVTLKGNNNDEVDSYQFHVMISELTILNKFSTPYDDGTDYVHYTKILEEVSKKNKLIVKVHASLVDGYVFMVEYGDANIPVVVKNNQLTKDLFRGDKVEITYSVKLSPATPTHLRLGVDPTSVKMLTRIADQHGQPVSRCGELVMFPKSPQVMFNVFALKYDIGDNLFWSYTLINFEDPDLFKKIREKMQVAWDANVATSVKGRNYFINPKLKVCAKGTGNMIVPTQANPQILINNIDDLTVEVLP